MQNFKKNNEKIPRKTVYIRTDVQTYGQAWNLRISPTRGPKTFANRIIFFLSNEKEFKKRKIFLKVTIKFLQRIFTNTW